MSSDPSKPASGGSKKKGGNKKGTSKSNDAKNKVFKLERDAESGMNPVPILTGYGARGERLRHIVHDGALRMPKSALDLIDDAVAETGLSAAPQYDLPGLDSVVRPSVDAKLETHIVTHLSLEKAVVEEPVAPHMMGLDGMPIPAQPRLVTVFRTKAENKTYKRPRSGTNVPEKQAPTERIRGGGDSDRMNVDPERKSQIPLMPSQSTQPSSGYASMPNTSQQPSQSAPQPPRPVPSSQHAAASAPVPQQPHSSVSSSTTSQQGEKSNVTIPKVQKLLTKPEPHYTVHRPGPNDEMVTPADQLTPKPDWYKKDGIAHVERTMLPEWFDQSASHRTPETYKKARETILSMSDVVANRNVTTAMVRRSIAGDAGSLQRLRNFLTHWGLINEDATNDSAPTASVLRENFPVPKVLDEKLRDDLVNAVVEQSNKKRKLNSEDQSIDWSEVALKVGNGASSTDCERTFLSMPLTPPTQPNVVVPAEGPTKPTRDESRQEFVRDLIETCDPTVMRKVTETAMQAMTDASKAKEAQSAALLGMITSRSVEEARKAEDSLESVLSQVLDQRMKKLENRMAMMEDIESILEAEKVALELERRDLYTARCRHWFGGS